MSNIEEKMVFAVAPDGTGDGVPLIILGIPKGAWEYMKDGKTHTFDLTKAGAPCKLVLFGADDHDAAKAVLDQAARNLNLPMLDERNKDFSIKGKDAT